MPYEPEAAEPSGMPYQLDGSLTCSLTARTTGETYRVDIAIPSGAAPENGWPSILLLDGRGNFGTCVEAMRRMSRRSDATGVVPMAVIAISPARQDREIAIRRRDFGTRVGPDEEATGAHGFIEFLDGELFTAMREHAHLDPAARTLFGHSLAGYFTLWVLANRPEVFRAYAAISPSIWSDKAGLVDSLSALPRRDRRALVCIGEWEDELPPWQAVLPGSADVKARRAERQMVATAREVAELLSGKLGEDRTMFRLLPEEDHASIISAAIPRALRMASLG